MKKIEIYYNLEKEEKEEIKNLAYEMVCQKLKSMFIYDYDLETIKENYIVLAMERIERENTKWKRTNILFITFL